MSSRGGAIPKKLWNHFDAYHGEISGAARHQMIHNASKERPHQKNGRGIFQLTLKTIESTLVKRLLEGWTHPLRHVARDHMMDQDVKQIHDKVKNLVKSK